MSPTFVNVLLTTLLAGAIAANAESHTISFKNQCGTGTPQLIINGAVASNGSDFTATSSISGIAYLQTGDCGFNGDNCVTIEFTLGNSGFSSVDLSLIEPHAFNIASGFTYTNAASCANAGANCGAAHCRDAFYQSNDNEVQVGCPANDAGLEIVFCESGTWTNSGLVSEADAGGPEISAASSSSQVISTSASASSTSASSSAILSASSTSTEITGSSSTTASAASASSSPSVSTTSSASEHTCAPGKRKRNAKRSGSGVQQKKSAHRRANALRNAHL